MTPEAIKQKLADYQQQGLRVVVSSSFQTHSIPLLHIVSECNPSIPVIFLDTGFLFVETLTFRDQVMAQLGLTQLVVARSELSRHQQRDSHGRFYFASDPDRCCAINKTTPMDQQLLSADVWVSGVRREQNLNRRDMQTEQSGPQGTRRFHPMLDWSKDAIDAYRQRYQLPEHPLDQQGYLSIGCQPCTRKSTSEDERDGRWFGLNKTECGLHLEPQKS